MVIKTTAAALGLIASLVAGVTVTTDTPRGPDARSTLDARTAEPETTGSAPRSGSGARARAEISVSLS